MAIRKILTEEDPTLRKKSKPVTEFDANLAQLLDDMAETMYKADGAGLSAVQVGVLKNVFITDIGRGKTEFVNPVIVKQTGVNKIKKEGCLSVPGKWGMVERPEKIWVTYQDRYGNQCADQIKGYAAKAFCHEYDHLQGILYTDIAYELHD